MPPCCGKRTCSPHPSGAQPCIPPPPPRPAATGRGASETQWCASAHFRRQAHISKIDATSELPRPKKPSISPQKRHTKGMSRVRECQSDGEAGCKRRGLARIFGSAGFCKTGGKICPQIADVLGLHGLAETRMSSPQSPHTFYLQVYCKLSKPAGKAVPANLAEPQIAPRFGCPFCKTAQNRKKRPGPRYRKPRSRQGQSA